MSTVLDVDNLGSAGFVMSGPSGSFAHAGQSVSTAGDFDGDGFDDIIVGAPYATSGFIGSSYVLFGHGGGFGDVDLAHLDPSDGFEIKSGSADYSATSVSDAGDINGDGFDDLIIGGSSGWYGFSDSNAYVVFGRASGPGTIDLTNLSATDGFTIHDTTPTSYGPYGVGHSVSAAGDVNGDGIGDMLIGSFTGTGYIVFGNASGFGAIDLASLNPSQGFAIETGSSDRISELSAAGDVNGDGIDDVVVGAAWGAGGAAYVVFGHPGTSDAVNLSTLTSSQGFKITAADNSTGGRVSGAGDFNGDGYADLIIAADTADTGGTDAGAAYIIYGRAGGANVNLDQLSPSAGMVITGATPGDYTASGGVSAAGDVNGDGLGDVIIGAPSANVAYVIYGRTDGLGAIDLANLAPSDGFVVQGHDGDLAGSSVSGAGDINKDGYDDIIVGAPNAANGDGKAYVIFGAATPTPHITGTDAGETLTGTNGNDYIDAMGGNDILYGLGGNDRLYGGSGNDRLDGGAGLDRMYGGTGDDWYIVRDATDYVYENPGEGTDRVSSYVDYRLRANVENLTLAGSADLQGTGNDLANVIIGNSGANVLSGLGGNDRLIGGAGDDRLYGGDGNDRLEGGAGHDILHGGAGDDAYYVTDATDYVVELAGEGTDTVYSTVSLTLRANVENLRLLGSAAINGYGNDLANAIAGNDAANVLKGGNGDDQLSGNGGADHLYGGSGADHVSGGAGDDWIEGGAGRDALYGGSGADSFVFRDGDFSGATPSTADHIYDFNPAEGDIIRLDAVDANSMVSGNQAFTFIGTAAFGNTAGELRYEQISGNTYLSGDTNGDGVADFMVRIDGSHVLTNSDLVL